MKLNEGLVTIKGKFIDEHTFEDEFGNNVDLIKSVEPADDNSDSNDSQQSNSGSNNSNDDNQNQSNSNSQNGNQGDNSPSNDSQSNDDSQQSDNSDQDNSQSNNSSNNEEQELQFKEPDPSKTYIDNKSGKAYRYDKSNKQFFEVER